MLTLLSSLLCFLNFFKIRMTEFRLLNFLRLLLLTWLLLLLRPQLLPLLLLLLLLLLPSFTSTVSLHLVVTTATTASPTASTTAATTTKRLWSKEIDSLSQVAAGAPLMTPMTAKPMVTLWIKKKIMNHSVTLQAMIRHWLSEVQYDPKKGNTLQQMCVGPQILKCPMDRIYLGTESSSLEAFLFWLVLDGAHYASSTYISPPHETTHYIAAKARSQ